MVDHRLLLKKLMAYGFGNSALKLITNYFENRKQYTKIGDSMSTLMLLLLGVPQGSVLGPLLFLIFINDLPVYLQNVMTTLFADDTTLMIPGDSIATLESKLRQSLEHLTSWCDHNRLHVNWTKTFVMVLTNKRIVIPSSISYKNVNIEVVKQFKLLGVVLDNKLNFNGSNRNNVWPSIKSCSLSNDYFIFQLK